MKKNKWWLCGPYHPGGNKAHKHKLFALVNVQMALGQTAVCPRVNRAKKFMCSPQSTGNINFSSGEPAGCPRVVLGNLCVQSLCAFFLPYIRQERSAQNGRADGQGQKLRSGPRNHGNTIILMRTSHDPKARSSMTPMRVRRHQSEQFQVDVAPYLGSKNDEQIDTTKQLTKSWGVKTRTRQNW